MPYFTLTYAEKESVNIYANSTHHYGPLYAVFLTLDHENPSYYFDPLSLYDVVAVAVDEKDLVIGNCVWMEMDHACDLVVPP